MKLPEYPELAKTEPLTPQGAEGDGIAEDETALL